MGRVNGKEQAAQPCAGNFQLAQHHPEQQGVERMDEDVHHMEAVDDKILVGDGMSGMHHCVSPKLVFHPEHGGFEGKIIGGLVGVEAVVVFSCAPDALFDGTERRPQYVTNQPGRFWLAQFAACLVHLFFAGDAACPDFPKSTPVGGVFVGSVDGVGANVHERFVRRDLLIVVPKKSGRHRRDVNHHGDEKERARKGERVHLLPKGGGDFEKNKVSGSSAHGEPEGEFPEDRRTPHAVKAGLTLQKGDKLGAFVFVQKIVAEGQHEEAAKPGQEQPRRFPKWSVRMFCDGGRRGDLRWFHAVEVAT